MLNLSAIENSEGLEGQLEKYSASTKVALKKSSALGLAAASFAIGTSESEATIVVRDVNTTFDTTGDVSLDIEGLGGAVDFTFQVNATSYTFALVGGVGGNQVAGRVDNYFGGSYNYVDRLASGSAIGPARDFLDNPTDTVDNYLALSTTSGSFTGDFIDADSNPITGFIGIAITDGQDVNYGWVEVTVDLANLSGEIIRYGIETEAGQAINAGAVPEPNSLACLAVGAAGMLGWRRRRKAA